jgi:hypothetical protein
VKFTPFDKAMTALILQVKTKNCPELEKPTDIIYEIHEPEVPNFIDGPMPTTDEPI